MFNRSTNVSASGKAWVALDQVYCFLVAIVDHNTYKQIIRHTGVRYRICIIANAVYSWY